MLHRPRRPAARPGAALVEFAFVVIPLFLFLFALLEYGRYSMMRNLMVVAAREGARLAVVNTDVNGNSTNKTTSDVEQRVRDLLAVRGLDHLTVQVYAVDSTGMLVSANWEGSATYEHGIVVEVRADYAALFPTLGFLSPDGRNVIPLQAKSMMKSEGN